MNKKIIIIFAILLIIILVGGAFLIKYFSDKKEETVVEEIVPEEEITEEQNRQTIVSLYFLNKETSEIQPEARLIDIKEIMNQPYDKLINLLIEGPKNEKNQKLIPENTKLNKTYMEGDIVVLDFSSEFLNYDKSTENYKNNMLKSIVNTLTELTEVNGVKILINGEPNTDFAETYYRSEN